MLVWLETNFGFEITRRDEWFRLIYLFIRSIFKLVPKFRLDWIEPAFEIVLKLGAKHFATRVMRHKVLLRIYFDLLYLLLDLRVDVAIFNWLRLLCFPLFVSQSWLFVSHVLLRWYQRTQHNVFIHRAFAITGQVYSILRVKCVSKIVWSFKVISRTFCKCFRFSKLQFLELEDLKIWSFVSLKTLLKESFAESNVFVLRLIHFYFILIY